MRTIHSIGDKIVYGGELRTIVDITSFYVLDNKEIVIADTEANEDEDKATILRLCEYLNISHATLVANDRRRLSVASRQAISWWLVSRYHWTQERIARQLHCNRSTIAHHIQRFEDLISVKDFYAKKSLNALKSNDK